MLLLIQRGNAAVFKAIQFIKLAFLFLMILLLNLTQKEVSEYMYTPGTILLFLRLYKW